MADLRSRGVRAIDATADRGARALQGRGVRRDWLLTIEVFGLLAPVLFCLVGAWQLLLLMLMPKP